jgi:hypothetical protein
MLRLSLFSAKIGGAAVLAFLMISLPAAAKGGGGGSEGAGRTASTESNVLKGKTQCPPNQVLVAKTQKCIPK